MGTSLGTILECCVSTAEKHNSIIYFIGEYIRILCEYCRIMSYGEDAGEYIRMLCEHYLNFNTGHISHTETYLHVW